jgi:hypothetical protein
MTLLRFSEQLRYGFLERVDVMKKTKFGDDRNDKFLVAFLGSLVLANFATAANSIVFTCWFLPFVYPDEYHVLDIINLKMVMLYFSWTVGKVVLLINILPFILAFFFWRALLYSRRGQ